MPDRTYLRVRRRRNAIASAVIRLDHKRSAEDDLLALDQLGVEDDDRSPPTKKPRTAVWRRVSDWTETSGRVVEAVLQDDGVETAPQNSKRRRLSLLRPSTPPPAAELPKDKPKAYPVLNPCQRLVDDSLSEVFTGAKAVGEHFRFCTGDERLSDQWRQWLAWPHRESGTLLHACALWNDATIAERLLVLESSELLQIKNAEGRTAGDIARLMGHSQVADLIATAGGDDAFEYDLYCLEEDTDNNSRDAEDVYELDNGMLYLDDKGRLVVDQVPPQEDADEMDSNDEDWTGNDYPEEETSIVSDDDDSFDDERVLHDFRTRPVPSYELDDTSAEFDAAYGIYGQREPEYDDEA